MPKRFKLMQATLAEQVDGPWPVFKKLPKGTIVEQPRDSHLYGYYNGQQMRIQMDEHLLADKLQRGHLVALS